MQVFKTPKGYNHEVEIAGVGMLGANGLGGVPVERAVMTMTELQEKDDAGRLKLDDDGNPIPLTGSKLTAAAKQFADARGLEVVSLSEEKVQGLAAERGALPDFGAEDVLAASQSIYERVHAQGAEPINTTAEEMNLSSERQIREFRAEQEAAEEARKEAIKAAPEAVQKEEAE